MGCYTACMGSINCLTLWSRCITITHVKVFLAGLGINKMDKKLSNKGGCQYTHGNLILTLRSVSMTESGITHPCTAGKGDIHNFLNCPCFLLTDPNHFSSTCLLKAQQYYDCRFYVYWLNSTV